MEEPNTTEQNALDNPRDFKSEVPQTTEEIIKSVNGTGSFGDEQSRRKAWVLAELSKMEKEAWTFDFEAAFALDVTIEPVKQLNEQDRIAIARHEEIIEKIDNSGSKTREDREARKASIEDIKLLQKSRSDRDSIIKNLQRIAENKKNQAIEVRMRMNHLAKQYVELFD